METVLADLGAQQTELSSLVSGRNETELLAESRCDAWTVADVLLHLAQTNEMAVASMQGRLADWVGAAAEGLPQTGTVDDWAGVLVDRERTTAQESLARWDASVESQAAAFAGCDPSARVLWVAGELAARTLAATRLTEAWIHTVDIAVAYGPPPAPTDRLAHTARLAWRTVPYALTRESIEPAGPVAFDLIAPDGSSWSFGEIALAATVVRGPAIDLCTVAGQRADAADTALTASGPDAAAVLRLVRTFA